MSYERVSTAIVNKLRSIANIGTVHDYERFAVRESDFRTYYLQEDESVRGWYVTRRSFSASEHDSELNKVETIWTLQGYASLLDDKKSGVETQKLIDAIVRAFRNDETLDGAVSTTIATSTAGIQLEEFQPVMFAGVLCHSIRLTLTTVDFENTAEDESGDGQFTSGQIEWDQEAKDRSKAFADPPADAAPNHPIEARDILKPEQ